MSRFEASVCASCFLDDVEAVLCSNGGLLLVGCGGNSVSNRFLSGMPLWVYFGA